MLHNQLILLILLLLLLLRIIPISVAIINKSISGSFFLIQLIRLFFFCLVSDIVLIKSTAAFHRESLFPCYWTACSNNSTEYCRMSYVFREINTCNVIAPLLLLSVFIVALSLLLVWRWNPQNNVRHSDAFPQCNKIQRYITRATGKDCTMLNHEKITVLLSTTRR